jgi:hypothetical protein
MPLIGVLEPNLDDAEQEIGFGLKIINGSERKPGVVAERPKRFLIELELHTDRGFVAPPCVPEVSGNHLAGVAVTLDPIP